MADDYSQNKAPESDIPMLFGLLDEHPFVQSSADWKSLGRVVRAFDTNFRELEELITEPDSDPGVLLQIFTQENVIDRENFFDELYRCLHNFMSILTTLIDNARVLSRKYKQRDFVDEYEKRKLGPSTMPQAKFLQDFRNNLVHHKVPPVQTSMAFGRSPGSNALDDISFRVKFNAKRLLESGKWSSESKQFLATQDEIVLIDCVGEYYEEVMKLYEWMFSQFPVLHAEEISDFQALQEQLKNLLYRKSSSQ